MSSIPTITEKDIQYVVGASRLQRGRKYMKNLIKKRDGVSALHHFLSNIPL